MSEHNKKIERLVSLIPQGRKKAVSNGCLQEQLSLTRREVSKLVHDARMSGYVINSDRGYYIPTTDDEYICGYDHLWSKSVSVLSSQKAVRAEIVRRGLLDQTKEARSRERKKNEC